jgi:hypothetical protein
VRYIICMMYDMYNIYIHINMCNRILCTYVCTSRIVGYVILYIEIYVYIYVRDNHMCNHTSQLYVSSSIV